MIEVLSDHLAFNGYLGLVPHGDQKKGMAYKWLRHKSDMEKEKKYMPIEFYLEPFLKEYVKDEMHKMRQTCVDLGDYFMKHSTPKIRREIAPVIFTIAKTAHEKRWSRIPLLKIQGTRRLNLPHPSRRKMHRKSLLCQSRKRQNLREPLQWALGKF